MISLTKNIAIIEMCETIKKSIKSARLLGIFTKLTVAALFASFVLPFGEFIGSIILLFVMCTAIGVLIFLARYIFYKIQEKYKSN